MIDLLKNKELLKPSLILSISYLLICSQSAIIQSIIICIIILISFSKINNINKFFINIFLFPLSIITLCVLLSTLNLSWKVNFYNAFSELKILILFALPLTYYSFFKIFVKFNNKNYQKIIENFLKTIAFVYFFILIFGYIYTGEIRHTANLGHSINIAYILTYLLYYSYSNINFIWRSIIFFNIVLLGSTTALALILVVFLFKSKFYFHNKLILVFIFTLFFFSYSIYFREKNFFSMDLYDFDRAQIWYYYLTGIYKDFDILNYLFGYGLGREIHGETGRGFDVLDYWFLNSFSSDGVYSYGTHNDYLRIFIDFGLIGLISIFIFLFKMLPKPLFIIVCLASVTNTTLYSTPDILVLSLISFSYIQSRGNA